MKSAQLRSLDWCSFSLKRPRNSSYLSQTRLGVDDVRLAVSGDLLDPAFQEVSLTPIDLNPRCLPALDFEPMFRAGMVKILLQQYLP
jgi:hypothetical protein